MEQYHSLLMRTQK